MANSQISDSSRFGKSHSSTKKLTVALLCLILSLVLPLSVFAEDEIPALEIDTGTGDDAVNVILNEAADIDIATGDGNDTLEVNVDAASALSGEEVPITADEGSTPLGSADNGDTTLANPVVTEQHIADPTTYENAIQQSVRNTLKNLTNGSKSATITVSAGTYYGDISISTANLASGVTLDDDFELVIKAEGAENNEHELTADADGSARIQGNIAIENLNVTLAGLYYCINSLISAKNSNVGIFGTELADNVNLALDNTSSAEIHTGKGADTVNVSIGVPSPEGSTGAENSSLSVNTGAGEDTVTVNTKERKFKTIDITGAAIILHGNMKAKNFSASARDEAGIAGFGKQKSVVVNASVIFDKDAIITADNSVTVMASNILRYGTDATVTAESVKAAAKIMVKGKINADSIDLISGSTIDTAGNLGTSAVTLVRNESSVKLADAAVLKADKVKINANGESDIFAAGILLNLDTVAATVEGADITASDVDIRATSAVTLSNQVNADEKGIVNIVNVIDSLDANSDADFAPALAEMSACLKKAFTGSTQSGGKTISSYSREDTLATVNNSNITANNLSVNADKKFNGTVKDTNDSATPASQVVALLYGQVKAEVSGNSVLSVSDLLEVNTVSDIDVNSLGGNFNFTLNGIDTYAGIADNVGINTNAAKLKTLTIHNSTGLKENVSAPALRALLSSGLNAQAYLGSGKLVELGGLSVLNDATLNRTLAATRVPGTNASGQNAFGEAVSSMVLNDTLSARSARNVNAAKVKVHSTGNNRSTNTARASSKGDTSSQDDPYDDQSADSEINQLLTALSAVSSRAAFGNINGSALNTMKNDRILAQTPEVADNRFGTEAFTLVQLSNMAGISGDMSADELSIQAVLKGIEEEASANICTNAIRDVDANKCSCFNAIALNQVNYNNVASINSTGTVTVTSISVLSDANLLATAEATPGKGDKSLIYTPNIARILVNGNTDAIIDGGVTVKGGNVKVNAKLNENDKAIVNVTNEDQIGIAFSMIETIANVKSAIDGSAKVTASALELKALSTHNANTLAVAGMNPDGGLTETFEYAYDVADAVTFIADVITAYVGQNATVTVTGDNSIYTKNGKAALLILAEGKGSTQTKADAFDCGKGELLSDKLYTDSAEGATAAIAICNSTVVAQSLGNVSVEKGKAAINAISDFDDVVLAVIAVNGTANRLMKYNEDEAYYYLRLFKTFFVSRKFEGNENNATATHINSWLTRFKNSENLSYLAEIDNASNALPLSMNILFTQDTRTVKLDSSANELKSLLTPLIETVFGDIEDSSFWKWVSDTFGVNADLTTMIVDGIVGSFCGNKINYAAVVATLVSEREAKALAGNSITAKGLDVIAENTSDFRVSADGDQMRNGSKTDVGRAVGLVCNKNIARAEILSNSIINVDGNVNVLANLIQNMDKTFREDYTVYALSGRMSDFRTILTNITADAPFGSMLVTFFGTSLAIAANHSESAALIGAKALMDCSGDLVVKAEDQTRLAVKGGDTSSDFKLLYAIADLSAISSGKSDDGNVMSSGSGGGHAIIHACSIVRAQIMNGATINAKSLQLNALKKPVTAPHTDAKGNYVSTYHAQRILTRDASTGSKGYINVVTGNDGEVQLSDGDLITVTAENLKSYLSTASYYLESINGSMGNGEDDYQEGGAMSVLILKDEVSSCIGDEVTITTSGSINVEARTESDARVIGGSRDKLLVCTGSGMSGAICYNRDKTWTSVGIRCKITSTGASYRQYARSNYDIMLAATSQLPMNASVGLSFSGLTFKKAADSTAYCFVYNETWSEVAQKAASLADRTVITAYGDVSVEASSHSLSDIALKAMAANFSVTVIADILRNGNTSGSCTAIFLNQGKTKAVVGDFAKLESTNGNVTVAARSSDDSTLISEAFTFGASVEQGGVLSSKGKQGGTAILVNFTKTAVDTLIGKSAELKARENILVLSEGASIANSYTKGTALGTKASSFGIMGAWFQRTLNTTIDENAKLTAGKNITVDTISDEFGVAFGQSVCFAASVGPPDSGGSMALTIGAIVSRSTMNTTVRSGARLEAGGSVNVDTDLRSENNIFAGGVNASLNGAIGVAVDAGIYLNNLTTTVDQGAVLVARGDVESSYTNSVGRNEKRRGIYVRTRGNEKIMQVAISVAAGALDSVYNGVIDVIVIRNNVKTQFNGKAVSGFTSEEAGEAANSESEISIDAEDVASQIDFAGGMAVGGTKAPKGATILCLIYNKNVEALTGKSAVLRASEDITLSAKAEDELWLLTVAVSVGASGTAIAGDVNAVIFMDVTSATADGIYTAGRDINILADTATDFTILGAGFAASGENGACAVVAFTYFTAQTRAVVARGAELYAGNDINILATSDEFTTPDCAGIGVGGGNGIAGTVDIVISKVICQAYVEGDSILTAGGNVSISAKDSYRLFAIVAGVAIGGSAGISISVLVTVATNNVNAWIGSGTVVTAGKNVTVQADSYRKAESYVAGVGGGGSAGAAPAVNVIVAGSKLPQDAVDAMGRGNIDYQANLNQCLTVSSDNNAMSIGADFSKDIAGDGERVDDVKPGGKDGWNGYGQDDNRKAEDYAGDVANVDSDNANENTESSLKDQDGDVTKGVNGKEASEVDLNAKNKEASKAAADDAASAIIYSNVTVNAGGDINVLANDVLVAELLAGSVGLGGSAGIGLGVTVAVLHSNVSAKVLAGSVLTADGDITVSAASGSAARKLSDCQLKATARNEDQDNNKKDQRQEANKMLSDNDIADTGNDAVSTIRLISLCVAGGGTVGIGVAAAVLTVYSEVEALMDGTVTKANSVNVLSNMNYGNVVAAVLAVSAGGGAGLAASVGFVYFRGTADCSIGENAIIGSTAPVKAVNVSSKGDTCGMVGAAAAAFGGAGAGAAGVALVFNRTAVKNYIANGATVNARNGGVSVDTSYNSASKALIISLSISGGFSAGATVSVVSNNLNVENFIGLSKEQMNSKSGENTRKTTILASNINVTADSTGELWVLGVGVSGGVVALNGVVSICFNNVSAQSYIIGADISNGNNTKTTNVKVDSRLNGDAKATTAGVALGAVAGGASVVIAEVSASSLCEVNVADCTMLIENLTIGGSKCSSEVRVIELSVSGGLGAAAINFGLAINKANFLCHLTGNEKGVLNAGTVKMDMVGNAYTNVLLFSAVIAAVAIGSSVGITELRATQEALVDGNAQMTINSLSVSSTQNIENPNVAYSTDLGSPSGKSNDENAGENDRKSYNLGLLSVNFNKMSQVMIYGIKFGAKCVGINVGIALADATCRAMVNPENLTLGSAGNGYLNVRTQANTNADCVVKEFGASGFGAGAMVSYAYANGTVESIVSTKGTITAQGGVNVATDYISNAIAIAKPSAGGLAANFAVNVAISKCKTIANALISGTGTIDAGKADITVMTNGRAVSFAEVQAAKVTVSALSVGFSLVDSALKVQQTASVSGATLKGGSLKVLSFYNVSNSSASANPAKPAVLTDYGAIASVGASLGSVGLASVKVNLGFAVSDSTVKAIVGNGSVDMSGDVYINTIASSYAETNIASVQGIEISGLSATCNYLFSQAKGTYEAAIDSGASTDAVINAGNIYVITACNTKSSSVTGGYGAAAGLIQVKVNIARANVISEANACVRGKGTLNVSGNLTVKTVGGGHAYSRVIEPLFSVSLVNVAVSNLRSNLNARQNALVTADGNFNVGGKVSVVSEFDASGNGADSQVGNREGFSISFIGAGVNAAYSVANLVNKAGIIGNNGVLNAGSVQVNAISKSKANAVALKPVSVGVASVAVNFAEARTADLTEAFIGNGSSFTVNSNGNVEVIATSETTSYTQFASGGSASLISGSSGSVTSYVGRSESDRQTVRAYVANNAKILAKGNIKISAYNTATVIARMTEGFKVSAVNVSDSNVTTVSWLRTEAYVGENAYVESITGNVSIAAEDYVSADALVNGNGVGLLLSADVKAAKNTVFSDVYAVLMPNATVIAYGNLDIISRSNAGISTYTEANTGGLFACGSLTARTDVHRVVRTQLRSGSIAKSRYKNLNVQSEAGRNDIIRTRASGSAAGLVGIGGANVSTNLRSDSEVDAEAAQLYADFGTLNVKAIVAARYVETSGNYDAAGAVASPATNVQYDWFDCHNTSPCLIARVNISRNSLVRGDIVNIAAETKEISISTTSNAKAGGLGGSVRGAADARFNLTVRVDVSNSKIQAYNKASLWTNATPTSSGTHLYVYGSAKLISAGGKVRGEAVLNGTAESILNINGTEIRAYNVSLSNTGFNGNVSVSASRTGISIFCVREKQEDNNLRRTSSTTVGKDCAIYISGGAMGIRAEADVLGNVYVSGSASGIFSSDALTIGGKLMPKGAGTLSAPGVDLAGVKLIDSAEYRIWFENYYEGTVTLPAMDLSMSRSEHGTPRVYANNASISYLWTTNLIDIYSFNGGNIRFGNIVCNEHGITNIVWEGEAGDLVANTIHSGTAGEPRISPLWTEFLNITNVRNIGESSNTYERDSRNQVNAQVDNNTYFMVMMGNSAEINIQSIGNVYLQPILTAFTRANPLAALPTSVEGAVNLKSIVADGLVDILMGSAIGVSYMPGAGGITVEATNNAPVFIGVTKNGNAELTGESLERYLVDVDLTTGEKKYELSDGTTFCVDADGAFLRLDSEVQAEVVEIDDKLFFILASEIDTDGNTHYVYVTDKGVVTMEEGFNGSFTVYIDYINLFTGFNSDVVKATEIVDAQRYILNDKDSKTDFSGYYVSVGVGGDEQGNHPFYEITGKALEEILNNITLQPQLKGTFGDYYTEKNGVSPLIHVYSLNNEQDSDKGDNDVILVLYDNTEYVGIFVEDALGVYTKVVVVDNGSLLDPFSNLLTYTSKGGTQVVRTDWDMDMGEGQDPLHVEGWLVRRPDYVMGERVYKDYYRLTSATGYYYRYQDEDVEALYELGYDTNEDGNVIYGGYVTIAPISKEVEDEETGDTVTRLFPVSIQLKLRNGSYTITDTLSLSKDGKTLISEKDGVKREYNVADNAFAYTYEDGSSFSFKDGTVTLRNRDLRYEQISSKVAFTADGTYYCFDDEKGWVETECVNGVISFNNIPVLTIRKGEFEDEECTIYTTYDETGTAQFDVYMVGTRIVDSVDLVSVRPKTFAAGLITDMIEGKEYGVGSYVIGNITSGKTPNEDLTNKDIFLRFDDSCITLTRSKKSQDEYDLISDGDVYYYYDLDGISNGGTNVEPIAVKTNEEVDGQVYYKNWDGTDKTYFKDSLYEEFDGNTDYVFAPNTIFDSKSHYVLVNKSGNIVAKNLGIMEGAYVVFSSTMENGKVVLTGTTVVGIDIPSVLDTYFQIDADGDVEIEKLIVNPNATTDISSYNGSLFMDTLTVDGGRSSTNPDFSARFIATIDVDIVMSQKNPEGKNQPINAINGADVKLISLHGGFFGDYGENTQERTANRKQDDRTISVTNSSVSISTEKASVITNVDVMHGTFEMESRDDNIYFDLITARSNVTLAANKNIDVLHEYVDNAGNHAVIRFVDVDYEGVRYDGETISTADDSEIDKESTLTLRAGGNIGRPDCWLYIDVPSTLTPTIQLATNFYIDAQAGALLDWDLYKYWVSSGYGVEKLNVGFETVVSGTSVDYLSYSDLENFRSLLDISDNSKLAAWIIKRADDVNGSNNSFCQYADVKQTLCSLLGKSSSESLKRSDLENALKMLGATAPSLAAYVQGKLKEQSTLSDAQALELVETEIANALSSAASGSAEAKAVLVAMLNAGAVSYNYSLTDLINYLFKQSSFYSADLQQLLNQAVEEAQKSKSKAEAEKNAAQKALESAESAFVTARSNEAAAIDAIYKAIEAGMALSSSVKVDGTRVLPGEKDYERVYNSVLGLINSYVAGKLDNRTLTDNIRKTLEGLRSFKDYKSQTQSSTSAANLATLADQLISAKAESQRSFAALSGALATDRAKTERYAELNDSYQSSMTSAEIARELEALLKDNGKWSEALLELEDCAEELDASRKAFEEIARSASAAEKQQARERMARAAVAYTEAMKNLSSIYTRVYTLANTHYDQSDRAFSLNLGEVYGSAYLYNTGDISVEMDPAYAYDTLYRSIQERAEAGEITVDYENHTSDLILANVRSEHGSVSVVNRGGSILAADLNSSNDGVEWFYRNDGVTYGYDTAFGWYTMGSNGVKTSFDPYAYLNDGVHFLFEDGKWYRATASGWEEFVPNLDTLGPVVANWFDTDTINGFEGTESVSKNFEKAHTFSGELTLNAHKSIGTETAPVITQVNVNKAVKVYNASVNMDPLQIGEGIRFDDAALDIYDQLLGSDYLRDNLLSMLNAYSVLGSERVLPLRLAGNSSLISSLLNRKASASTEAVYDYGNENVQLTEIVYTDAKGNVIRTWGLNVSVRSDWIRINDVDDAAPIHLTAETGDIYVSEKDGSVKGGDISAAGDVYYEVPGSVSTKNAPLTVQVDGTLNLDVGQGDIYMKVKDDLDLRSNLPSAHYEIEGISASGDHTGSITLTQTNENPKALSGYIHALSDIAITTDGDIGTASKPFEISNRVANDGYGVLSFNAKNTYINGVRADGKPNNIALDNCIADGNLVLNNSGSIVNRSDSRYEDLMDDLLEKQEEYNKASAELDAAKALKASVENLPLTETELGAEEALKHAEEVLMEKKLNLAAANEERALAQSRYDQIKEDYEQALKDGNCTLADLDTLVEAEGELKRAQQIYNQAASETSKAQSDYNQAQSYWNETADYETRVLNQLQSRINAAENALSAAEEELSKAQEEYEKAVAAGDSAKIAKAQEEIEKAETKVLESEEALQSANDAYDAFNNDELTALHEYVDERVAQAEENAKKAAESVENAKNLMEAQVELNEAARAVDEAEKNDDGSAAAALKKQIAENTLKAATYVESAARLVQKSENGTEEEKALANTALEEARQAMKMIELGNDFLNQYDEAYARQAGVAKNASELEKLEAVAEQQKLAMTMLNAIDSLAEAEDQAHTDKAETDLHAGKDALNAAEEAYEQQLELLKREQELEAAREELKAAEKAWNEQLAKNPDLKKTLDKAEDDEEIRAARLRLLEAEAALPVAEQKLADQQEVLNAANELKTQKSDIAEATEKSDEKIERAEELTEELNTAKAEQKKLNQETEELNNAVKQSKSAYETKLKTLRNRIDSVKDENLLDNKELNELLEHVEELRTLTKDELKEYAFQLSERFEEAKKKDYSAEEILEDLEDVLAAANDYCENRTALEDTKRELEQKNEEVKELTRSLEAAEEERRSALEEESRTIADNGGLSENSSKTRAEAAPVYDEKNRDERDTAEQSNLTVTGNADIKAGGNVGETDKNLGIEVGGKLTLQSGGEIGLTSGKDVNLNKAAAAKDVSITTTGSINNTNNSNEPVISGDKVTLNAITGDNSDGKDHNVGADKQLKINASGLSGTADNLSVENVSKGNTELGNITVNEKAEIRLNGSASQSEGAVLSANSLKLTAKGQVGTKGDKSEPAPVYADDTAISTPVDIIKRDGAITLNVDNLELSADSANIHSISPNTIISVSAREELLLTAIGNVMPGRKILNTRSADLMALGNIGTPSKGFAVPGKFNVRTFYGVNNVTYVCMNTIYAPGACAYGGFPYGSRLILSEMNAALTGENAELIRSALSNKLFATNVRIEMPNGKLYKGSAFLMFAVEGAEDGSTVYALLVRNGNVVLLKGYVRNGYAVFFVDEFDADGDSSIVILSEEQAKQLDLSGVRLVTEQNYDDCFDVLIERSKAGMSDI